MSAILPLLSSNNYSIQQLKASTASPDDSIPTFNSVLESHLQEDISKTIGHKVSKDAEQKTGESDVVTTAVDTAEVAQQPDLLSLIMTAQIVPTETTTSTALETPANHVDRSQLQTLTTTSDIPQGSMAGANSTPLVTTTNPLMTAQSVPTETTTSAALETPANHVDRSQLETLTSTSDILQGTIAGTDSATLVTTTNPLKNTGSPLINLADPSKQMTTGRNSEEHLPITINELDSVEPTPQGFNPSMSTALPSLQAPGNSPVYQITPALHQAGWDQAISQRVVWMANQHLQSVTLNINPEHLGPIQIQVQMDNQQMANVQFIALQPEVRVALQNAIPLLSDMLEQSGIQLGQSDVSSNNPNSNSGKQEQNNSTWASINNPLLSPNSTEVASEKSVVSGHSLINVYA